jgi:hypothetical protein
MSRIDPHQAFFTSDSLPLLQALPWRLTNLRLNLAILRNLALIRALAGRE